jgi:hypothetical protein
MGSQWSTTGFKSDRGPFLTSDMQKFSCQRFGFGFLAKHRPRYSKSGNDSSVQKERLHDVSFRIEEEKATEMKKTSGVYIAGKALLRLK